MYLQDQPSPKELESTEKGPSEAGAKPASNFEALGKLFKDPRRMIPTKWQKLHEATMMKNMQQVRCQHTLSWTQEQHHRRSSKGRTRQQQRFSQERRRRNSEDCHDTAVNNQDETRKVGGSQNAKNWCNLVFFSMVRLREHTVHPRG